MFKPTLENAEEIIDFICDFATDHIDVDLIKEYFFNCTAVLKIVPIENLREGYESNNIRDLKKEHAYRQLPIETIPPLIVENNIVLDGNHRLRIAKKMKVKQILIYEIIEQSL